MQEVKFYLLEEDYILIEDRPILRLWGKTKNGKSVLVTVEDFIPYFYIVAGSLTDLKQRVKTLEIEGRRILNAESERKLLYGKEKKTLKIEVQRPPDVPKFRDMVKDWRGVEGEYEYSISFPKRFLIDNNIRPSGMIEAEGEEIESDQADICLKASSVKQLDRDIIDPKQLKILAFDIEVVPDKEKEKIIMVSLVDSTGFRKIITYGYGLKGRHIEMVHDEKELLERFAEMVKKQDPDIIVGYNTDRYDFVKITERADELKADFKIGRDKSEVQFKRAGIFSAARVKGRAHIDLFAFIENILQNTLSTEILTLDNVARELIGEGKDPLTWEEIQRAWKEGRLEKVGKYCLKDSELTYKLAMQLLPQIFEISYLVGQPIFDISRMTYSQLVEWLLIREAHKTGEIIPNRPKFPEIQKRRRAPPYAGGYVHSPVEGIHKNIALFDFSSLYPSITITHNVSPETLECDCCRKDSKNRVPEDHDHSHYFCHKKEGFIPKVLKKLVKERNEIKLVGMKRSRTQAEWYKALYNRQYALKIIANASYGYYGYAGSRWYSRVAAESITAFGRYYIKKVIKFAQESGFDVIYGDTDSLFIKVKSKKEAREFLKKANAQLPGAMELDFSGTYKTGIFTLSKTGKAAKKRYALLDSKGNILVRGFEKVRRDWSKIAKDTQEKVLEAVLKKESINDAVKITKKTIDNIKKGKVDMEDLNIYTQITKPISQYESIGPHVAAAKKALSRGRMIGIGSTVKYIITKGPGSISSRAEPAEDAKNYDPEYYINHQVVPAALRVLSGLSITEEDLLKKTDRPGQIPLSKFVKK